jgi:hypothetical protein
MKVERQSGEAEEDELPNAHPARGQRMDDRLVQLDRQALKARVRNDDERPGIEDRARVADRQSSR